MTPSPSDEEKQGLTHSFKSQMGYGTAVTSASSKKTAPRTRKFISKKVSRTDTLIGIALKYGVTVQDLKRENRLWTNDSLFLRESLLIPLTPQNEGILDPDDVIVVFDGNTQTTVTSPQSTSSAMREVFASPRHLNGTGEGKTRNLEQTDTAVLEVETSDHSRAKPVSFSSSSLSSSSSSSVKQSRSSSSSALSSSSSSSSPLSSAPHNGKSRSSSAGFPSSDHSANASLSAGGAAGDSADFFSKYDLNIARLKGNVAKLESKASTHLNGLPFLDENPLALPPPKNSRRSSTGSSTSSSSRRSRRTSSPPRVVTVTDEDEGESSSGTNRHNSPVLMIRSRTNQRLIRSTLERSQQASDEIFEL